MVLEDANHSFVFDLTEVIVEPSDGIEGLWHAEADDSIGDP